MAPCETALHTTSLWHGGKTKHPRRKADKVWSWLVMFGDVWSCLVMFGDVVMTVPEVDSNSGSNASCQTLLMVGEPSHALMTAGDIEVTLW